MQHPCQQTIPQTFSPTKALRTFVDFLGVMVGVQKSKDGSIATLGEARESLGGRDFQPSIMLGPIFVYMYIYNAMKSLTVVAIYHHISSYYQFMSSSMLLVFTGII